MAQQRKTVKAPPAKPILVIKSDNDTRKNEAAHANVEKTILENKIAVLESYKNKLGDIVLVCESEDKRNELKRLVAEKDEHIVMNTPAEKRASITIVGLKQQYHKDEIIEMLLLQNGFIKDFANSNDIKKHIEIFAVQPLKNNRERYQAFANVSVTLREGLLYYGDKITLGLTSCKIYNRYHVKICYNCQKYGHYMKDCPTPNNPVCGKCASHDHCTRDCDSFEIECINCVRNSNNDTSHQTNSYKCPSLQQQQEIVKRRAPNRLNWMVHRHLPPR